MTIAYTSAREFLKKIRDLDLLIDTYQEELDKLMARLTSTTVRQKEVNVMTSKKDTLPEDIEKIIEWQKLINDSIDEYVDAKNDAKKVIDKIPSLVQQVVLIKYYFQRKTLEQIAVELDRSYQWVCELRERGLEEFSKIFEKN